MSASSSSSRGNRPASSRQPEHALVLPHSLPLPASDAPSLGPDQSTRRIALGGRRTPISGRGTPEGSGGSGAQPIDLTLESSDDDEDEPIVTRANIVNRGDPPAEMAHGGRRIRNEPVEQHFENLRRITAQRQAEMQALIDADMEDERRREILSPDPIRQPRIGLGGAVLRAGNRQINYNGRQRQNTTSARSIALQTPRQGYRPHNFADAADVERATRPMVQEDFNRYGPDAERLPFFSMARLFGNHLADGPNMRNIIRNFTQGFIPGVGFGVAGPGPGHHAADDIDTRMSKIQAVHRDPPEAGFVSSFDLDTIDGTIALDEDGDLTPKSVYLDCAVCHDPLLLSAAYQTPLDRVWALRCGHMVDQKCLNKVSIPITAEQIKNTINLVNLSPLDEEPPRKKTRARRTNRSQANKPPIHVYQCPVEGCGREHTAVRKDEVWVQTDDGGAIQSFI